MLMNCPSFSAAPRILVRLDTSRRTLASDMNTLLPCELPPAVRRIDSDAAPHDNEAARAAMSALSMSCLAQIKWETHIHNETACLFWMRGLCLLAERLEPGRQLLYALDGTRRHYAHRRHRFPVPPRRPMRDLLASRVAARLRYHWFQEWNQCDRFRAVQSMSAAAFSEMRCLEPTRRRGVLGRTQVGEVLRGPQVPPVVVVVQTLFPVTLVKGTTLRWTLAPLPQAAHAWLWSISMLLVVLLICLLVASRCLSYPT